MIKNLKVGLISLICMLFFCHSTIAQETKSIEPQPLGRVISKLTAQYKINFLYEEVHIKQKKVVYNPEKYKDKTISDVLNDLLLPLNLSWLKIDKQNFSIFSTLVKVIEDKSNSTKPSLPDSTGKDKISGLVLDEKSKPVEYTTVTLLVAADSTTVVNSLTDLDGRYTFHFIKPGTYKIRISAMGHAPYMTKAFTIGGSTQAVIEPIALQTTNETLKEVTITSNKQLVETKSDRLVYNVDNSAMAVGNSLQVLKSAPFVRVSSDNSVSLQGKRTMILIDNKPVPDASLENILETMPAGNILKIELITQPSVKYDAGYGAVINIVTKKSQVEGITGNLRADGSTGNYAKGATNASATYKRKNLTIYTSAGVNRANNFFSINSERYQNPTEPTELITNDWARISRNMLYSFQGSIDLQIDKNQSIGAFVDIGNFHFKGPWTTTNEFRKNNAKPDSVLFTDATFDQVARSRTYNFNYHLLSDSGTNELTVLTTLTPWKRNLFQNFPSTLYGPSGEVIRIPPLYQMRNTTNINVFITQADYARQFKDQWKFEIGLKYQNTDSKTSVIYQDYRTGGLNIVPELSNRNNLKEAIASAYGMITKDWKNDKLQLGIRMENTDVNFVGYTKQNYYDFFPSLLYQHTANKDINMSLSYKATIRRPPYHELVPYTVFLNQYTIEQGNPALTPQFDNIYSLTTNIHKLNLTLSYTKTKGLIGVFPLKQDELTKVTYFSRQNLDKGREVALYVFYPFRINSWWETMNNGTPIAYNKAEGFVLGQEFMVDAFRSDFQSSHIFKLSKNIKVQVDAYYWTGYSQDLSTYSGNKNIDASFLFNFWEGKGQFRLGGNELVFKRNDYLLKRNYGNFRTNERINTDSKRIFFGFTYKFGKSRIQKADTKLGNEDALKRL